MIVPLTPLMFLRRAEKLFPQKVGVVCEGRRFSYSEFGQRVHRLSNALASLSLQKGDTVAYLGHNCHRLLEAYYGVLQMGAILLPLNVRLTAKDFLYMLDHSEARVLFCESEFLPAINSIRRQLQREVVFVVLDAPTSEQWLSDRSYEAHLEHASAGEFSSAIDDENDVAELFYTSGTTAQPKGVMLTHRNLYLHAMSVMWALRTDDSEVQLHTIPLFHANGWGVTHTITGAGGTHVMLPRFEPKRLLQLVQQEHVTTFNLVPTMATMLLQENGMKEYDVSSLRLIHMGGSAMPKALMKELKERLGCEVSCGYGLTETSPVLTVALMKSHLREEGDAFYRRAAMTGLELPGTEVRVVDNSGDDVPRDGETVGEIIARGNIVMKGYWKQPEETAQAIRDGWLYTGDLATMDSEGYVLIVDRKKDIILRGGENISSIEVEKALYSHPAVLECAVIAVPDGKWGETPKAFVVLKDGVRCTMKDLRRHCKATLAGYKVPASIEMVEALPKGGTGKIQKKRLREKYWQGCEKQVQ
ncbi:MAG: long-chain-fatty-acid--CoA ligase [Acidobacteria bacterium]|nr:long-chain-fatty-acid--CoA ligase [Acidobacteriota bacterium]